MMAWFDELFQCYFCKVLFYQSQFFTAFRFRKDNILIHCLFVMRKLLLTILLCATNVLVGESKLSLRLLEKPISENLPVGSTVGTFSVLGNSFTSASAGGSHTLAIKDDGSLWAWGNNEWGQLGDGSDVDNYSPQEVIDSDVAKVATGTNHSIAIMEDGSLWSWGHNGSGQLGGGTHRLSPQQVLESGVVQVSTNSNHTLSIKEDGSLWTWGYNKWGQLGNGTTYNSYIPHKVEDSGVIKTATGIYHSLAIKDDGSVSSWGRNNYGQIGDGSSTDRTKPTTIIDSRVIQIAAGDFHSLAIKQGGSLWTWGRNHYGQLGDETTTNRSKPQYIDSKFTQIAGGGYHSLAIKEDGSLWAWGYNNWGQLGDGTTNNRSRPHKIIDSGVVQVAAGVNHSIAIKDDGSLWAWGYNNGGQLGDSTISTTRAPKKIGPPTPSITLAESDEPNDNHLVEIDGNNLKLLQPLSLEDTKVLTIHVRAEIETEQVEQTFEISLFEILGNNFLGWLYFSEFPWVYSANSNSWYYLITEGNSLHTFDQFNGSWNQLLNVRLPITPAFLDGRTKAEEDVLVDPEQFGFSNDTHLAERKSESYNEGFTAGADFDEFAPESPIGLKIKFVYDIGLISEVTFNNDGLNGSYTSRNDSGSILYVYQKLTKNTASLTLNTAHEIIVGTLNFDSPTTGRLTGTSNDTSGNPIGSGSADGKFWILP